MAGTITVKHQITELKRELHMRNRKYPGWIAEGWLTQEQGDLQISRLSAAITSLQFLQAALDAEAKAEEEKGRLL